MSERVRNNTTDYAGHAGIHVRFLQRKREPPSEKQLNRYGALQDLYGTRVRARAVIWQVKIRRNR